MSAACQPNMPPKRARRGKTKRKRRPSEDTEDKPVVDETAFEPLTAAELVRCACAYTLAGHN